ncbi:MAG: hypothetical protein A2X23_10855 [Chloroflexi bacterium GWC2_73_18]|nr:MAG: hypothetical protein A2X23_10855 [Chloroflexi bacterium GWC2_73_18]
MTNVDRVERWVRLAGAIAVLPPLVAVFWGLGKGLRRPSGRETGRARALLRGPVLTVETILFFGACATLWRPVRRQPSGPLRALALVLGTVLYFPGLALVMWGRIALGAMFNVSSGFGARLYAGHRLVSGGPFAIVRHPVYLGYLLAAVGGLLLYRTWTLVLLVAISPALVLRARREEEALAGEFGEAWEAYRRRVPAWLPRLPQLPAEASPAKR